MLGLSSRSFPPLLLFRHRLDEANPSAYPIMDNVICYIPNEDQT
jgi:hypothetical protein